MSDVQDSRIVDRHSAIAERSAPLKPPLKVVGGTDHAQFVRDAIERHHRKPAREMRPETLQAWREAASRHASREVTHVASEHRLGAHDHTPNAPAQAHPLHGGSHVQGWKNAISKLGVHPASVERVAALLDHMNVNTRGKLLRAFDKVGEDAKVAGNDPHQAVSNALFALLKDHADAHRSKV